MEEAVAAPRIADAVQKDCREPMSSVSLVDLLKLKCEICEVSMC